MKSYFIVVPDLFMIGAQRSAILIAKEILKEGNKVTLIKMHRTDDLTDELPHNIIIKNIYADKFWNRSFLKYFYHSYLLAKHFKKFRPDYSISIAPSANLVNLVANFLSPFKVKIICEEHQHLTQSKKTDREEWRFNWNIIYFFLIRIYKYCYKFRVVSLSAKSDFIKNWAIPKDKIICVEPLIDNERITRNLKSNSEKIIIPKEKNHIRFCSLGRLTIQKDFELLINSFKKFLEKREGELLIAGEGPEKENLKKLIDNYKISKNCKLIGFVKNGDSFIRQGDVFVLTSKWEGFPATLIESLYIGTPVIAVDCYSGPKELLEDKYGLLVKRSEVEICNAMIKMNDDINLRNSFIDKGKKRASEYLPSGNWKKYSKLISK